MRISINTGWLFGKAKAKELKPVTLPHDATIYQKRSKGSMLKAMTGYYAGGDYQYKKTLFIPESYREKSVFLDFEGVYRHSTLYVNGKKACYKAYGFTQFCVCLDAFLKYGEENELLLTIECPRWFHNRWYAGCGIYRDMSMLVLPKTHIKPYGFCVSTVSHEPAVVRVRTELCDAAELSPEISVEILDGDRVLASGSGADIEIELDSVELWNDEHPRLYTARASLRVGVETIDSIETSFGVCHLEWDSDKGLLVNGEPTKLRGGCIHNDNGILGMLTTDATEERRVRKIKESGFNAIRCAHHPASRALLAACDRYGVYIMNEGFDAWYNTKMPKDFGGDFRGMYRVEIEAMVRNSFNHPSVVLYSLGNEIMEVSSFDGKQYAREMLKIIKELDPYRPVTMGMNAAMARYYIRNNKLDERSEAKKYKNPFYFARRKFTFLWALLFAIEDNNTGKFDEKIKAEDARATDPICSMLDINGYNYYSRHYEAMRELRPNKLILGSENLVTRNVYNWEKVKKYPYVIGDFVWTLQDNLGETNTGGLRYKKGNPMPYPWISSYEGILDLLGRAWPVIHQYRLVWERERGIFLAAQPLALGGKEPEHNLWRDTETIESWSYGDVSGKPSFVDVYTDAPLAQLYLNGRLVGEGSVKNYHVRFFLDYEPGLLEAAGLSENGEELYRNSLKTARPGEYMLSAEQSKPELCAGECEIGFIDIAVCDGEGIVHAEPEHEINVSVEGAAVLQGLGSANPVNPERYNQCFHRTRYGRLLAAIRATGEKGEIKVTISAENMEPLIMRFTAV